MTRKINEKISLMIILLIGFGLFGIFAFFGSIQLNLTLIILGILSLVSVSYCIGGYAEQRDQKEIQKNEKAKNNYHS